MICSGGLTKSSPLRERSPAHLLSPISMPTALCFNSTIGSTPSIEASESDTSGPTMTRRSSSGGLLSPEVELSGQPGNKVGEEQEGFYLLKKDSQRRMTLTRVLSQDEAKICQVWLRSIHQDVGQAVLHMNHLELLMRGLKDYISEPNQDVLMTTIRTLKEELDFDSTAINQLYSAIYLFQTAVNEVLRLHSIKPHWMFALDNLVRNAVQAAITVLSPELGANLLGHDRGQSGTDGPEEGSTSGVSTVNSVKSHKSSDSVDNKYWREYQDQMGALKTENMKLLQELLESQKVYQAMLQQVIGDQKIQMGALSQLCESINRRTVRQESGYNSTISGGEPVSPIPGFLPQISVTDHNATPADTRLTEWLQGLGVDASSIDRFLYEEYTLEDILFHVSREDLRRLNLRGGIELRIWKAVLQHRKDNEI